MMSAGLETRVKVETMIATGARNDCGKCDCEGYRSGEIGSDKAVIDM